VAVSSLCTSRRGLSPRGLPSAVSEGRSRGQSASWGRRLMGAAGCRGAFGVTLQFVLALSARGFCTTRRELNLAHRRRRAPGLLVAVSEISQTCPPSCSPARRDYGASMASAVGVAVRQGEPSRIRNFVRKCACFIRAGQAHGFMAEHRPPRSWRWALRRSSMTCAASTRRTR